MSAQPSPSAKKENDIFGGFQRPVANYVYCPNQFFDICLKSKSRGVVRIVAYVLRQTLGWLDDNGQPVNQDIGVSYSDLIKRAGISHGAIADSLRKAVSMGFIVPVQQGEMNTRGVLGRGAEYRLNWDQSGSYARSIGEFEGFFTGEGNRSPIPNDFFDRVIRNETLAVTKVVGTVLRHTICYQNQFGGRRTESPLSCTFIQRYANISKRAAVVEALKYSAEIGYIQKVEGGVFSNRPQEQSAAVYAVRWLERDQNRRDWPKKEPADLSKETLAKKGTSETPKTEPAELAKKGTSIEKTLSNKTLKQQPAVASNEKAIRQLIAVGFRRDDATKLVAERGVEIIQNQVAWLNERDARNPVALLRKAILENWDMPEKYRLKERAEKLRKREREKLETASHEDEKAQLRKQLQRQRREPLLQIWKESNRLQRMEWIGKAATRQTSKSIADFILKKGATTPCPPVQVLDEIAMDKAMPTVSNASLAPHS